VNEADVAEAVGVLRAIMSDPKAKGADRLNAAREILDRSCGRPVQPDLQELVEAAESMVAGRNSSHV
jgi:hypothetical protein